MSAASAGLCAAKSAGTVVEAELLEQVTVLAQAQWPEEARDGRRLQLLVKRCRRQRRSAVGAAERLFLHEVDIHRPAGETSIQAIPRAAPGG